LSFCEDGWETINKGGNFRDKGEIITTPVKFPLNTTLQTLYQTVGLYDD